MSLGLLRSWLFTIPLAVLVTAIGTSLAIAAVTFAPGGRCHRIVGRSWGAVVLFIFGARGRVRGL